MSVLSQGECLEIYTVPLNGPCFLVSLYALLFLFENWAFEKNSNLSQSLQTSPVPVQCFTSWVCSELKNKPEMKA